MNRPAIKVTPSIYAAICLAAMGLLRWQNLWQRGILEHDEGHALLNANTWRHIILWVLRGGPLQADENSIAALRDTLHREGGTLYSAGKFGYSLLLAVAGLPGDVTVRLGLTLAWLCGLAVCCLAGVATWQYSKNMLSAAIVVIMCVVSPVLQTLSREVSGTIWALMFGLAGLVLMQSSIGRSGTSSRLRSAAGGLCLGYGFLCHFNIAPFILGAFGAAGCMAAQEFARPLRLRAALVALWPAAASSLFILALAEAATQVVDYRLRHVFPEYRSVFDELIHLVRRDQVPMLSGVLYGDGVIGWGREAWAYYGHIFLWKESGFVLMVLAVPYFAHRAPGTWKKLLAPGVLFVIPLVFYALYVYRVERVFGMLITSGWIIIGVAIGEDLTRHYLPTSPAHRRFSRAMVLVILSIVAASLSLVRLGLGDMRSPMPSLVRDTLAYISRHGGRVTAGSFDASFAPLWKWTIVEEARNEPYRPARNYIDFSTFANPEIVFTDPRSWVRDDGPAFPVSREEVADSFIIAKYTRTMPNWSLSSADLRY